MSIETLKNRLLHKKSPKDKLTSLGWNLVEIPMYVSSKPGTKPDIYRFLERQLGDGEVRLYPHGEIEFTNCSQVEKDIFNAEIDKAKLLEYITTTYGH